jgi:hypothetical protein
MTNEPSEDSALLDAHDERQRGQPARARTSSKARNVALVLFLACLGAAALATYHNLPDASSSSPAASRTPIQTRK